MTAGGPTSDTAPSPSLATGSRSRVQPHHVVAAVLLIALALVPVISTLIAQPFYVTLFTRVIIFALAAVGLNLILGYGALVSFGHAMYIGIGAYAVGILAHHGIVNGWIQLAVALSVGALVAVVIGLVCLRTSGMAFIMITLAFAQMFYFLSISLKQYGGDDGLTILTRSDFGLFTLNSNTVLYYATFILLLAALVLLQRLVHSRFGMVLRGCRSNERRMAALGFPTLRYKLTAYVISALVCVLAGMLLANLTKFAAPSYMAWQASGDLIVMIVLGGMATVVGPVAGAVALLIFEEILASYTTHWMIVLGPLIVVIVLTAKKGLYGALVDRDRQRARARARS
ncbi:MAG TPA: branched-chain amino acid ABC transporter permease [Casimicrobiaceae bacterium]|nr:branched-chain amino acid ABC transporter permease [Casimicrobiaceae bacterium]